MKPELKSVLCVFCSPKSSTVVLASFGRASNDFPFSNFKVPPNMMTCFCPGSKLKAVAVCHRRGCTFPGRVSWGEIRRWVDIMNYVTSPLEVSVHMIDLVISWLVTLMTVNTIVYLEVNTDLVYTADSVNWTSHIFIFTSPLTLLHLPELTSRIHASCRVLPFLSHPPVTSSWGCSSP